MPKSSTTPASTTSPAPSRSGSACTRVFVVDKHDTPLMPTSPKHAREWLTSGRAVVVRRNPFTIRLRDRVGGDTQPMELKLDPGSKVTGAAVTVLGAKRGWHVVAAFELHHRGQAIRDALLSRRQRRAGRRSRKTRYRQARFSNRTRPTGWLAPSLQSRVDNIVTLAKRLVRVCPITSLPVEQVRFDTQLLQDATISGVDYQQGTLAGYEVREYLLEKWGRQCAYCNAKGVPLQIDHLTARSRGGSDRVSNLTLACEKCNQKKGNRHLDEFLAKQPDLLRRLLAQAKTTLKDAAAVNSTRKALVGILQATFPHLTIFPSTGGRTKYNRSQQGYAKTHWMDAACVGESGERVEVSAIQDITKLVAKGRGSRQMCRLNKYGFPRTAAKRAKRLHNFQTGDRVRLTQKNGKYRGIHDGVVAVRSTGRFDVITVGKIKITANHTSFSRLQRFDGYAYQMVKIQPHHQTIRRAG